jgi:hypothetical protein
MNTIHYAGNLLQNDPSSKRTTYIVSFKIKTFVIANILLSLASEFYIYYKQEYFYLYLFIIFLFKLCGYNLFIIHTVFSIIFIVINPTGK